LSNAGGIGAISVADEQSFGIEPEDVSGLGGRGCSDGGKSGDFESLAECGLARAFTKAIWLAGTHHYQTVIGGKGGIMGVDGVEGQVGRGAKVEDFGSSGLKFTTESVVLRLSDSKVRGMVEA
jgi:hypothetical protein